MDSSQGYLKITKSKWIGTSKWTGSPRGYLKNPSGWVHPEDTLKFTKSSRGWVHPSGRVHPKYLPSPQEDRYILPRILVLRWTDKHMYQKEEPTHGKSIFKIARLKATGIITKH